MKFYIAELQTVKSYRQAYSVEATTLTAAKRTAAKQQAFYDTVLVIGTAVNANGWIVDPVCMKTNSHWVQVK